MQACCLKVEYRLCISVWLIHIMTTVHLLTSLNLVHITRQYAYCEIGIVFVLC